MPSLVLVKEEQATALPLKEYVAPSFPPTGYWLPIHVHWGDRRRWSKSVISRMEDGLLRQVVYLGEREDKAVAEVVRDQGPSTPRQQVANFYAKSLCERGERPHAAILFARLILTYHGRRNPGDVRECVN